MVQRLAEHGSTKRGTINQVETEHSENHATINQVETESVSRQSVPDSTEVDEC